jgi:hypothetical protein
MDSTETADVVAVEILVNMNAISEPIEVGARETGRAVRDRTLNVADRTDSRARRDR